MEPMLIPKMAKIHHCLRLSKIVSIYSVKVEEFGSNHLRKRVVFGDDANTVELLVAAGANATSVDEELIESNNRTLLCEAIESGISFSLSTRFSIVSYFTNNSTHSTYSNCR